MKISKNNIEYSVSLNGELPEADVLFQDLNVTAEKLDGTYKYVVLAIPYCAQSFFLRQVAYKLINHYGVDNLFWCESEVESYRAHRKNKLSFNKICTTEMLATEYFTSQGYEIL